MILIMTVLAAMALADGANAAATEPHCEVSQSYLLGDSDLSHVAEEVKSKQRLDISVVGTGSSALPGPDGAHFAYPARLEQVLQQQLPGVTVKVTAHIAPRQSTAEMAAGLAKVIADDKPSLVIWQAGTVDAMNGVEPEKFRTSLDEGADAVARGNADLILMNMQYSPRTESMLDVTPYADIMHIVAEQRGALLFDRLGIMHEWNDNGTFDLYTTTKNYDMARRVHDCIGWALASQIIATSHLDPSRLQTTR